MRRLLTRLNSVSPRLTGRAIAGLGTVVILTLGAGAGVAYARWTSHGAGSAVATVGTTSTVQVIAIAGGNNPSSTLVPGGSADLVLEFNNPNAIPVTIVGIVKNGNVSVSGGTGPGTPCTGGSSGNTGVDVTSSVLSVPIAVGNNVVVHIDTAHGGINGATMTTGSASGCQGATFKIPVTVTVHE